MDTERCELERRFPSASVQMLPSGGPFSGRCLLVFSTPVLARQLLSRTPLRMGGKPVVARRQAVNSEAYVAEERTRTVVFSNLNAMPAIVQQQFPTAEAITLLFKWPDGPPTGQALVVFSTTAEAEAVASQGVVDLNGPVRVAMAGDMETWKKERRRRSISVECRATILAADLGRRFPNAELVTRRGPGRFYVMFPTEAEAVAVATAKGLDVRAELVGLMEEEDSE
eukprot:EG_transcript_17170